MDSRHKLEMQFHDKREADRKVLSKEEFEKKYPNKRLYKISTNTSRYIEKLLKKYISKDTKVLDYCCGTGETSKEAAALTDEIFAIDISPESVFTAYENVRKILPDVNKSNFQVMNAESTDFENNLFDVIICNGVLHHLDTSLAFKELSRIVKKDGIIICHESLGYNPFIQLYRKLTPNIRTAWETDHILKNKDFDRAKRYFSKRNFKYFNLISLLTIPFIRTPIFPILKKLSHYLDSIILRIPIINLMAWQVVFTLKK